MNILIALLILLCVNIVSYVLYRIYNKEHWNNLSKMGKISYTAWMMFCGITYWIMLGMLFVGSYIMDIFKRNDNI